MKTKLLVLLVAIASVNAFAGDIVKKARKNDVASEYILKDNGDLFRTVGGNKCQVTSGVVDMKISAHPNDTAMMYFIKDGNLYILKNAENYGQCPKADKKVLMANIAHSGSNYKYNVVSNTNTLVVNVALDSSGKLVGWGNRDTAFTAYNIEDYSMNNNYNAKGKPYSRYVLFALTSGSCILKVDGDNVDQSAKDCDRNYSSIRDFKEFRSIN